MKRICKSLLTLGLLFTLCLNAESQEPRYGGILKMVIEPKF